MNITETKFIQFDSLHDKTHLVDPIGVNEALISKIIRLVKWLIFGDCAEKSRIQIGDKKIACLPLNGLNRWLPINEIKLNWYQTRFFIPLDVSLKNGQTTRILLNKNSFLKNNNLKPEQKTKLQKLFSQKNDDKNLKEIHNLFLELGLSEKNKDLTPLNDLEIKASRAFLETVGSAKKPNRNTTDIDLITRTVMRHPKEESLEILYRLHQSLKVKFLLASDEGLNWLLGGADFARGGFANATDLRHFLEKDPKSLSSSRLITGLETLLTAISYRSINARWVKAPYLPETNDQKAVFKICGVIYPHIVPLLASAYPDKDYCVMGDYYQTNPQKIDNQEAFVGPQRDELSDGSDCESPVKRPPRIPSKIFKKTKKQKETLTWVCAAQAGNVPIRYAPSGTITLSLAAASALLGYNPRESNVRELELLAGMLLIPTYERGDYHTIAETTAGSDYFLSHQVTAPSRISKIQNPKKAFTRGIDLMAQSVDIPYKAAIENLGAFRSSQCADVNYSTQEVAARGFEY